MKLIGFFPGRRQFLISLINSTFALSLGMISKAFDLLFHTGVAKAWEKPGSVEKRALRGIVVYYSATGNTAQVANAIYKGIKSVIACDVAPIKKVKPTDMAKYDLMAIGSPNWFMREPANVKIFTHDMPRMDGKHCIIFGTHGSMPEGQFWSMSRNILKKGMTIIGWSDWYGTDLLEGSQPDGEWGHPDQIDIAEAEAFGRRMAEHSKRIYAGEKAFIPEIPAPDKGQVNLWSPRLNEFGNISFASPRADILPEFDLTKCVYPRCNRCIENCPVRAIDFSMIAPAGSIVSKASTASPLVIKEACQHCGGLCERVCLYDAILYIGEKREFVINMKKCTYPECTICLDNCPQDAIDFSATPPVVHRRCEGGDYICFDVCPENAIEYPAMAGGHGPQAGPPMTGEAGEGDEGSYWTSHYGPRFRPLIRVEDIGSKGPVMSLTTYPRLLIKKELWPYNMDEG